jgi:glycosyltransferase involved in cell wall biosynthesis
MRICFYSGVKRPHDLEIYPWYRTDVEILSGLGFSVHASKRPLDVSLTSDAYFAWWPTSGFLPMLLAKARGKPFHLIAGGDDVVTQHPNFGFWARNPLVRGMIRNTVRRADQVIAVSEHAADQARLLGAKNVSVVYNAIDIEKYNPGKRTEGRDFLCMVAELSPYYLRRKRIATLIKAMPKVLSNYPDVRLLLIGRPAEGLSELQALGDRLGVSHAVVFLGSVTAEEKLRRLQSAFAYLQPTIHEAFGVAIAEAMSCGVPVVTSPVAAVPEVVGDCGLFAQPDDAEGFADCMLRLLRDPEFAACLGKRGRDRVVKQFSVNERRKGFERIYRSIPYFCES